jgi:hypothetical protein
MEDEQFFSIENSFKLLLKNGNYVKEFICEIEGDSAFSEQPIDNTSVFVSTDDYDSSDDFYATELIHLFKNNQSVAIIRLQHTIKLD